MKQVMLRVEGMSCQHCVRAIEGAVGSLGAAAKVDLAAKAVEVTYDEGRVTLQAIKEAIEEQGYTVA